MQLNLISVLIGLEQIYNSPVIKNLRLYLQDPLEGEDVNRAIFLLKSIEDDSSLKYIQTYMLNPLISNEKEKVLPLLKLLVNEKNEEILHYIKCYLLDPIDTKNIEKLLPLFKILDLNFSKEFLHQVRCSVINPTDILSIFKICFLSGIYDNFILDLSKAISSNPNANWNDALSKGQLFSKLWLIEEVKKLELNLGTVFVCAGWYGTLSALIMKDGSIDFKCFRSFDIDPTCESIADQLNKTAVTEDWKFKSTTLDIFDINYTQHPFQCWSKVNSRMSFPVETIPDTIINTSCDHISPFSKWWDLIPENKLVILQNNNSKIDDDHVNIINNIDEMKKQAPMSKILYEGVLILPDYTRFMLIGVK
jgi:hypothetical protein